VVYALAACEALVAKPAAKSAPRLAAGSQPPFRQAQPTVKFDRSMLETFRTGCMTNVRPNALSKPQVVAMIAERTALLDSGADHFTLLGVPRGATVEAVHAAYVELARNLRPNRLAELGITDETFAAQRLLVQIGIAFTVLTDRIRRPEYMETLRRTTRASTV
jgi:hypothetical protein